MLERSIWSLRQRDKKLKSNKNRCHTPQALRSKYGDSPKELSMEESVMILETYKPEMVDAMFRFISQSHEHELYMLHEANNTDFPDETLEDYIVKYRLKYFWNWLDEQEYRKEREVRHAEQRHSREPEGREQMP